MDRRSITRICMHGRVRQEQRIFKRHLYIERARARLHYYVSRVERCIHVVKIKIDRVPLSCREHNIIFYIRPYIEARKQRWRV